jgi:hypothetical protein
MPSPELVRRQLPEGALRANRVARGPLRFNALACVSKTDARVLVQEPVTPSSFESRDVGALYRFAARRRAPADMVCAGLA